MSTSHLLVRSRLSDTVVRSDHIECPPNGCRTARPGDGRVEWPTLALIAAFHGALVAIVAWHDVLPWPVALVLFALLGCLHMSMLHEVLHGHPTPIQLLNEAMVILPAVAWLPYPEYRDAHRLHHRVDLTVPGVDPESFYVDAATWERANPVWRMLLLANRTVLGRVLVWPGVVIVRTLIGAVRTAPFDRRLRRVWARPHPQRLRHVRTRLRRRRRAVVDVR